MAIKFSQFNERTDHTSGMYLVGYDGNQNIHITVDNLFDDFINGTENTITMFGAGGAVLTDSILSQDVGATILTVSGQLNVDADATFDTSITVTGDSTLNGNVTLGNAGADLITQTGTLYLNGPVKDTTDTLGDNDEILVSDGNGELNFQKLSETHVRSSEIVVQSIKANEALTKGDPVYIVDFQVGQEVNIVAKADASNPAKMPASGIIDEDYANQAFGTMTAFGSFNTNFDASGGSENWSIGDILFVKAGGGLTNIKPTGSDLIQNVAIVSRNHQQTGELEVVALGRTNDIPNLTPGRLWVGSTGNTIESQTLFVDEATGEVGIGTASPSYTADVAGTFRTAGQAIFAELGPVSVAELGGGSSTTSQFNIISTAGGGSFIAATNRLVFKANNKDAIKINNAGQLQFGEYGSGAFTGTSVYNLSLDFFGNIIETASSSTGTGTTNALPLWTDGPNGVLGDSIVSQNGSASDLFIDGKVGIGFDTPYSELHVRSDGNPLATVESYQSTGGNLQAAIVSVRAEETSTNTVSRGTITIHGPNSVNTTGANNFSLKNHTNGGQVVIVTKNSSGATKFPARFKPDGNIQFEEYGSGTFTGTDTYNLSVDSSGNIIETAPVTSNTYDLSGYGTNNGTAGVQLVGSDSSTDQVAITGAGTTSVTHSGNTITVTSNDQYTGTVTGSGTAGITGGQIPYWNSTTNITGTSQLNYSTVAGMGVVGIGNSSTSFGASRLVVGSNSGSSLMTLYSGSNDTSTIAFANGTSGNAQYRGQVRYNQQYDNLEFLTNGETFSRVYVDSASDLNLIDRTLNFRNNFPNAVGAYVDLPTNNQLSIGTNGSERLRIDESGNVGIGTTSPDALLEISGNAGADPGPITNPTTFRITDAGNAAAGAGDTTNPWGKIEFYSEDVSSAGPSVQAQIGSVYNTIFSNSSNLNFYTRASPYLPLSTRMTIDGSGDIAFGAYDATAVATTGSLNPSQSQQAVTEDTLAILAVDPDGNVVRGSQEGTWTFTKAQLDALTTSTTSGTTLIAAAGANKAVIIEESNLMIKYSGTGTMSSNSFVIRQAHNGDAAAEITRIPSGQINTIMSSAPANPSYGFYSRDLPLYNNDGRSYVTNKATFLSRISTNPTPTNLVSISIKLKYRLFNVATF